MHSSLATIAGTLIGAPSLDLIETCKLNGVDPQVYLASVPSRLINGWPMRKVDELMPWVCGRLQNATAVA